ncbi:MAG: nucleoside-diphosphate kinase [Patescibacteria group bacterium]|nr:nucleoside-diphosphate kinase [Patescibacteria group bacterium]
MERTLVILKPDAVQRGIVGDVISRFEKTGLKLVGVKMITADKDTLDKHYPSDRKEFINGLGERTLQSYKEMGLKPEEQFKDVTPHAIGMLVRQWLVDFMMSGPVLAIVLEGPHAIEIVRKIVGSTLPQKAVPGTIRGDYSFDSSYLANSANRPVRNLIHASGSTEEAEFEVGLWFSESEIHEYDTVHHRHMTS